MTTDCHVYNGMPATAPAGPALICAPQEIAAFVAGIKQGLADHLAAG
ncbi:DUF397 domain-containing protein [Streptomyces canus]|jgi:hypothetical protein|nr:DUF397 domain-containing protein [Streptomyces canus]